MKFSLKSVAQIITDNTNNPYVHAVIKEVYRDYGAGIKWNTVVVENYNTGNSYQALYPNLHDRIVNGEDIEYKEIEELVKTANELMA